MGRPEGATHGFFVSLKAVVAKITTAFFIPFIGVRVRTFLIAERWWRQREKAAH